MGALGYANGTSDPLVLPGRHAGRPHGDDLDIHGGGHPGALSDILAVDKQDALDRITKAWTAHDRCLNPDDWDDFLGMTDDEIFTEGLGLYLTWNDIVAWNPTLRYGSTGLLITLFPTKRMHPMGGRNSSRRSPCNARKPGPRPRDENRGQ